MKARAAVLLVAAACASVPVVGAPLEGRTANGIAYDVRGSGPTLVLLHGGVLDRRMPAFAAPPEKAAWVRGIVLANARLFRQSPTAERPTSPPALTRLTEVRAPTLIIIGDRDARDIRVAAESLAVGIPRVELVTVGSAGHLVNVWQPEVFRLQLLRFLVGGTQHGQRRATSDVS
jgi:pimeloyl-ACP methyl ester carboxylesterase